MTEIKKDPNYYNPLDKFLSQNTVSTINRETYLICNLTDKINKITVSLVFLRDWDSIECGSFENCIIPNKGAVFTFPCYWVCVPKELAFPYLTSIVDTFYAEYVSKWLGGTFVGESSNDTSSSGGTNNLPSCCPCQPII